MLPSSGLSGFPAFPAICRVSVYGRIGRTGGGWLRPRCSSASAAVPLRVLHTGGRWKRFRYYWFADVCTCRKPKKERKKPLHWLPGCVVSAGVGVDGILFAQRNIYQTSTISTSQMSPNKFFGQNRMELLLYRHSDNNKNVGKTQPDKKSFVSEWFRTAFRNQRGDILFAYIYVGCGGWPLEEGPLSCVPLV